MSGSDERRPTAADEVRALFRSADGADPSSLDRLLDGVPRAIAEAARRRRATRPRTVSDALVPLAVRFLPATALVTVALVVAALVVGMRGTDATAADDDDGLDRLVLVGSLGNGTDDPLLRALAPSEADDE